MVHKSEEEFGWITGTARSQLHSLTTKKAYRPENIVQTTPSRAREVSADISAWDGVAGFDFRTSIGIWQEFVWLRIENRRSMTT